MVIRKDESVCDPAHLPYWGRLQTQQCSAEPKEELPAGPGSHNSPQQTYADPCPRRGTQMHLNRASVHMISNT